MSGKAPAGTDGDYHTPPLTLTLHPTPCSTLNECLSHTRSSS